MATIYLKNLTHFYNNHHKHTNENKKKIFKNELNANEKYENMSLHRLSRAYVTKIFFLLTKKEKHFLKKSFTSEKHHVLLSLSLSRWVCIDFFSEKKRNIILFALKASLIFDLYFEIFEISIPIIKAVLASNSW